MSNLLPDECWYMIIATENTDFLNNLRFTCTRFHALIRDGKVRIFNCISSTSKSELVKHEKRKYTLHDTLLSIFPAHTREDRISVINKVFTHMDDNRYLLRFFSEKYTRDILDKFENLSHNGKELMDQYKDLKTYILRHVVYNHPKYGPLVHSCYKGHEACFKHWKRKHGDVLDKLLDASIECLIQVLDECVVPDDEVPDSCIKPQFIWEDCFGKYYKVYRGKYYVNELTQNELIYFILCLEEVELLYDPSFWPLVGGKPVENDEMVV